MSPTCRFSDPLHRSEEAREHACWTSVQASSCCSSLLAGRRRADPPRPLAFYAVQSFPPLARRSACAPASGWESVRSHLRAEAAPWWLCWEHTSAGIRPALLWARPVWVALSHSPAPVSLRGEAHGQRSLAGYSPWGRKELDTAEWLTHTPCPTTVFLGTPLFLPNAPAFCRCQPRHWGAPPTSPPSSPRDGWFLSEAELGPGQLDH